MSDDRRPEPDQPDSHQPETLRPELRGSPQDALEAHAEAEAATAAATNDTFEQAANGLPGSDAEQAMFADEDEVAPTQPPGKQERLQKILAQAGIASRRHAEELITQGRVQVNGKIVTELGTKADALRDHIRVDGKLLQGSERLRYFMLNKPKGFVTTVSDPEGRPTIMEFFAKTRERLYPVGRLDYLSEGLLLVTNDGELANKLTRAASGVEKTYLVKVSGEPTEEEIDRLREGVGIDRDKPGSGRVQTAPAEIRKIRQGDNPWYEVVLIEGRNRELRKMFEEIGHHVEKIRRVGYGPLVLDLEPGKLRELEPEELENLRRAADGKYRKPKSRDTRKRAASEAQLPTVKPRWNPKRGADARGDRTPSRRPEGRPAFGSNRAPNRSMSRGPNRGPERTSYRAPGRGPASGQERSQPRGAFRTAPRGESERPQRPSRPDARDRRDSSPRPFGGPPRDRGRLAEGPSRERGSRPAERGSRPAWNSKPERGSRPPRFDREAKPDRASIRPDQFQRPDRSAGRRPSGEFRTRPTEERSQSFGGKRPGPASGFREKKRLEIRPADDESGIRESGAQNRQERRPAPSHPSPSRSGPHPGRGPSAPGFKGQQRPPFDRDRRQATTRPPRFERDREERPRFDRPKAAGTGKPRSEFRPRSDRPAPAGRPGGPKGASGQARGIYGGRPAGGPGGRPGGKPSGKSGPGRSGSRPNGRRPGGKPGDKKRG